MKLSEYIRRWPHIVHQSTQHEWADKVEILEKKLERYERKEDGEEQCECHEEWHQIDELHLTHDGIWLCQESWNELIQEVKGG